MLILPTSATETDACQAGLKSRGVRDNEMWVMMHAPAQICPNNGVSATRIREIIGFWSAAGCMKNTPAEMSRALDSGICPRQPR